MLKKTYILAVIGWMYLIPAWGQSEKKTGYSLDYPAIFVNDSAYFRYGMKYAIDNLPEEFYRQIERSSSRAVSRDSLRCILSEGGTRDSIRVCAPRELIRVHSVEHVVWEKTNLSLDGLLSGSETISCVEDGAWLFDLSYQALFAERMEPKICRKLTLRIINYDPSFTSLEFRNVKVRISAFHTIASEQKQMKQGLKVNSVVTQKSDPTAPSLWHPCTYDLDLEGEIHGERILPDGTVSYGKLYEFRFRNRKNELRSLNHVRPSSFVEKGCS